MQVVRAGIWATIGGAALATVAVLSLITLGTHTSGLFGFGEVMAALLIGTITIGLIAANIVGGVTDRTRRRHMTTRIGKVDRAAVETGSRCSCRRLRIQIGETWVCAHCDHVAVG